MHTNLVMWQLIAVEKANEERTRYIQEVGGLLSRQFGVMQLCAHEGITPATRRLGILKSSKIRFGVASSRSANDPAQTMIASASTPSPRCNM